MGKAVIAGNWKMHMTCAEAQAFADGDPFTKSGMFTGMTITRMNKGQFNPQAAEGA